MVNLLVSSLFDKIIRAQIDIERPLGFSTIQGAGIHYIAVKRGLVIL